MLVHATTVAMAGLGVIILGPSGAGKSDLALRLVGEGALLVSDDQTHLSLREARIWARAPERIAGLLEVRGKGIVPCAVQASACLCLAVQLVTTAPDRLPEPSFWQPGDAAWPRLPQISLEACAASATAKVRITLATLQKAGFAEGA